MTITSAVILWALPQKDGSSNVREQFADDAGNLYYMDFQAPAGMVADSRLISDAQVLADSLGTTVQL